MELRTTLSMPYGYIRVGMKADKKSCLIFFFLLLSRSFTYLPSCFIFMKTEEYFFGCFLGILLSYRMNPFSFYAAYA